MEQVDALPLCLYNHNQECRKKKRAPKEPSRKLMMGQTIGKTVFKGNCVSEQVLTQKQG
jgi:hypothetical protein